MNLRDLKYLVVLSDYQHFGKAAQACFVSQPALSMQIKKLEETLGVKLLERTNRSVLLTEVGLAIAEHARQILNYVKEIHETAKLEQDPFSGELKIGIFPTLGPYLLPLIIPELTKKFPKISFYLVEAQTTSLLEDLKQGKLHTAFLALPILDKHIETTFLFEEEFLLAVAAKNPIAKQKRITQLDLENKNVLLLEEGHCLRDQALAICHKMNSTEAKNFRATSLETLRHMIVAGIGITLMPKLACSPTPGITYLSFDSPKPTRAIGMVWRNTTTKRVLLQAIVSHVKKIMTQHKEVKLNYKI